MEGLVGEIPDKMAQIDPLPSRAARFSGVDQKKMAGRGGSTGLGGGLLLAAKITHFLTALRRGAVRDWAIPMLSSKV